MNKNLTSLIHIYIIKQFCITFEYGGIQLQSEVHLLEFPNVAWKQIRG